MAEFSRAYADDGQRGEPAGSPLWFTASTPGVKRDGLDLRAQGWRLDDFTRNPVFLWAHGRADPPIGRVEAAVGVTLRTGVTFDQDDAFARKVESKYRRGFLNAVSVGWDFVDEQGAKLDARSLTLGEVRDSAFYNLTELSGVPVPADPDALLDSARSGLRSLGRQLVTLFDEMEEPDSDVEAEDLRAAVIDELRRLGVPIPAPPDETPAAPQPADKAGFFVPEPAARALLAIFEGKAA